MAALELGAFSLTDIQPGTEATAANRMDDIVAYGVRTERAGLDAYGIGEHHTADFAVASPAVALAAVAALTQRVRLTTTATVLSIHDPVRLYQDFAQLDLISHGRAELVLGRSAFTEPFGLFGIAMADYDTAFAERLDLLLAIRDQQRVTWSGRARPALMDAEIIPRTAEPMPLWIGVGGTRSSAERAGRLGLPMMLGLIGGTIDHARGVVDVYRAAGAAAGHAPESLHVGVTSHFFLADDAASARDEVFPYYQRYLAPKTPGGRGFRVGRADLDALSARRGALMVGGPTEIIEKILDLRATLGIDRFLAQVDFGGIPRDRVEHSIDLYGSVVAPAVRHVLAA